VGIRKKNISPLVREPKKRIGATVSRGFTGIDTILRLTFPNTGGRTGKRKTTTKGSAFGNK